jgi:hypothetical protein
METLVPMEQTVNQTFKKTQGCKLHCHPKISDKNQVMPNAPYSTDFYLLKILLLAGRGMWRTWGR